MPITNDFGTIPPKEVIVDRGERQRRSPEPDELLRSSIAQHGVLVPIILRKEPRGMVLVAGERRLMESVTLDLPTIPYRLLSSLSEFEAKIVELEENIKRKDLPWEDYSAAVYALHKMMTSQNDSHTAVKTAEMLAITPAHVSKCIALFEEQQKAPIVGKSSIHEAYNVVVRRKQRAQGEAMEQLLGAPPPPTPQVDSVLCGDFREWQSDGQRFNFLHCDFPYGIGAFDGPQMMGADEQTYGDKKEDFLSLFTALLDKIPKIMAMSSHVMFWYSRRWEADIIGGLSLQGFTAVQHPLIWLKSDNAGVSSDARRVPRHIYETCLLFYRGDRNLVKVKADAYSAPTARDEHPSAKNEAMLSHFMEMLVDEHTVMLDPTCGGGSALRAADALGAKMVFGIEKDEGYARQARERLENARRLRRMAKAV